MKKNFPHRTPLKLARRYIIPARILLVCLVIATPLAILDLTGILPLENGLIANMVTLLAGIYCGPILFYASAVGSIPGRVAQFYPESLFHHLRAEI